MIEPGAILEEARRYLHVREVPPGSNRGVQIDYFVSEAGLDPKGGFAWCAAFFGQMGRQTFGHAWPCPRTALVQAVVDWAKRPGAPAGLWVPSDGVPAPADAFVIWHASLGRYAHIGLVAEIVSPATTAAPVRFRTIEGNANPTGGREGYGVFQLERSGGPSVSYIRWRLALT